MILLTIVNVIVLIIDIFFIRVSINNIREVKEIQSLNKKIQNLNNEELESFSDK